MASNQIGIWNGKGRWQYSQIKNFDVSPYGLTIELKSGVKISLAGAYTMHQIADKLQMIEDAKAGQRARAK